MCENCDVTATRDFHTKVFESSISSNLIDRMIVYIEYVFALLAVCLPPLRIGLSKTTYHSVILYTHKYDNLHGKRIRCYVCEILMFSI